MRTFRSTHLQPEEISPENLTDSFVDLRLHELAAKTSIPSPDPDFPDLSQAFSDVSSDISGELLRLASLSAVEPTSDADQSPPISSPSEDIQQTLRTCVDTLENSSSSLSAKSAAAAELRQLAKHRSDLRAIIGGCPAAISSLIGLLRSSHPEAQENAVTALLNISLEEPNSAIITAAGAIKPLVYALKTGTAAAKQNAACALLSLSMIDDNRAVIGACGAIPPLVSLLVNGSSRGKKDALTTLYKLCGHDMNKERAVRAGAVGPLVDLAAERTAGTAEKAMIVLYTLAGVADGRRAIVEEGGVSVLVEAVEEGSSKGKEFAVAALLELCGGDDDAAGRLLVREGAIPPLVALTQSGTPRAKSKVRKP